MFPWQPKLIYLPVNTTSRVANNAGYIAQVSLDIPRSSIQYMHEADLKLLWHWIGSTLVQVMTFALQNLAITHYNDVIMDRAASQITSLTIVYSTVDWDADQRKHQSSASLAFVRGIHRGPVNSPHKWSVTRKMFPFDDVIMWTNVGFSSLRSSGSHLKEISLPHSSVTKTSFKIRFLKFHSNLSGSNELRSPLRSLLWVYDRNFLNLAFVDIDFHSPYCTRPHYTERLTDVKCVNWSPNYYFSGVVGPRFDSITRRFLTFGTKSHTIALLFNLQYIWTLIVEYYTEDLTFCFLHYKGVCNQWASYQIRKTAWCACAGNGGNVFPHRQLQRKLIVSDPGMHHGTCVTHVPWCMSGSLTRGGWENVPGFPGACAPAILCIWQEAHALLHTLNNVYWHVTLYFALMVELQGVYCEHLGENWPRYNDSALYTCTTIGCCSMTSTSQSLNCVIASAASCSVGIMKTTKFLILPDSDMVNFPHFIIDAITYPCRD